MEDDLSTLINELIVRHELARQEASDVPLRKLYNVLRAGAAAIEELIGGPAQKSDGCITIHVSCPACREPVKIVRRPTDGGQTISGVCGHCQHRLNY